ncbi:rab11 family-interacting protein [Pimephales promelas]|nr:rab11 family-interacting protein [Pimephales promelas]
MEQVLSSPQGCSEWEENAINLDDLFWASQYSGQTYSWENNLECVYPEWKTPPPHSPDLKGEGSPGSLEIVDGDLISFNSRSTSPTFSNLPVQNQHDFYNPPEQMPEFLQPVKVTATLNPLDVYTGLLPVSPVEVSCVDTNSNPKPSIICQAPPPTSKDIYLPSSAISPEPIPSDPPGSPYAPLQMDEEQMLLPELMTGHLYSEQESSKPSASNETYDDDLQSQETTKLSSEAKTAPLGESCISPKVCEESSHDISAECTFGAQLETVGEEARKEAVPSALTDNVVSEAKTELAPIAFIDLQADDPSTDSLLDKDRQESTLALPVHTPEHNALLELSPEDDILPEDHSQPTHSTEAEALSEVLHDGYGDLIPVAMFEILTDSVSCEAVPSLDVVIPSVTDAFELTDQEKCDLEPDALRLEIQDNIASVETGNPDDDHEAVDTLKVLETSDLHQNPEATNLKNKSDNLQNDYLNLDSSKSDNNQEPSGTIEEQINAQHKETALVDQLNDSMTAKSSAIVIDTPEENVTAHRDSHNTPLKVKEKLQSMSLQGGEGLDCRISTRSEVIPHCASNPESTPFTCEVDQLTLMDGLSGPDLTDNTETRSQSCEATGEGEVGFAARFTHQEDFHQLTPSPIDLALEQQVSSVSPSSPPLHRNVFPCGSSLDGEAYLTLMENTPDTSNISKHAEMTLDLCKASDSLPTKSLHDQRVPVDLINVSTAPHRSEEQSALRAVFQALDQDGDGFVHIEEFIEFAKAYGAEQVKDLTRFLDPSGLGVISFEDFHRGISAISNEGSDPDLYKTHLSAVEASGPPEDYDEQAEVSDSAYLGSESAYSECETFTDEDTTALVHPELHEDVETDSGIENTLTDGDDRNRFTLGSDLNGHTVVAVIGGEEEHFEDFGESNNASDLLLANQEEGRVGPDGEGDEEPLPHSESPLPHPLMLLSPSSSKRMSSKKAARHLQQSSNLDVMGDLTPDILDLADRDITDKVLLLEKRVCELEKDSSESEEQHARLRQENLTLVHRANALEEQLKEQEMRAEETLLTYTRKHRDALNKLQRDRDVEIENLQARLHQLDEENSELRSCVPCLRANIERLEEEKRKLQDEVEDVTDRLNEEIESRRKMSDKMSHERHTNQKEKECTQGLIEDLRKQLELLQLFKLETEARRGRSASSGLQEYNTHMKENELEQEIRRLKQDNRSLKEQNDELNGQIINLSIQGAKSLFTESLSESLAAEINNVSRSELMEAIHKQEEINFRLQDYIDRIIVAIMESNPSILEVK